MRRFRALRFAALAALLAGTLASQRVYVPPQPGEPARPQQPAQQPQAPPAVSPAKPAVPGQTTAPAQTAPTSSAAAAQVAAKEGLLSMNDVSLTEFIKIAAQMLKINYLLDPRVKGTVTLYTYGEVKPVDLMPLLETVLRINNAAIVKVGDLYRIVPVASVSNLPIDPVTNAEPKTLPDDERMVLTLIFLKYATATELDKLIKPFLGEGAKDTPYEPANLLIIEDNARNMKRTMQLIGMFDADTFAGQRVKLFEVENSRPSDLVKDLEGVFKAYALSEKSSAVRFIAVDRINTVIAVAPNPGIFTEVSNWIDKLDVQVKLPAGAVNNYFYRMKYGRAETVAVAIMALYSGNTMALASLAMMANGGGGFGGGFGGGMGYGGMGGGMGYGGMGGGMGYGGMGGGMGYGGMGGGMGNYGGNPYGYNYQNAGNSGGIISPPINSAVGTSAIPQAAVGPTTDLTGSYLAAGAGGQQTKGPHIIPNPFDNTLLVQGTPQEWEQINSLLRQLDVAPRQVLIDAKIYELDLTGAFSAGIQSYLDQRDTGPVSRTLTAAAGASGLNLSVGALVLHSHELLGVLNAAETRHQSRVISAPSIIATDSIPASMNVGQDVPVLTSEAVAGGVQQGGSSVFTNTVSSRSTGVTLQIMARVNSSGIVTMIIDQDVSEPQGNSSSNIDSPSFSRRSFTTQVTVQDGDTIAVGGFIQETKTDDSAGVPLLHRIPLLGAAFGSKSNSRARTELIIFLTPRVIYDTNQIQDATDEIKGNLKRIQKMMRNEKP
jgi:general secretion pathway protein D